MKNGFNVNKINQDGYLIIPISMANINSKQSPEECYKTVKYFSQKLNTFSNDVILLYTNGLYFNSDKQSYQLRQKMNKQIINHANAFRKLISKRKEYIINAFHYLPIDYIILNNSNYDTYFKIVRKRRL
jgi:hypothetical protein